MEKQINFSMKKRIFLVFALLFFSLFIFDIVSAANLIVFNNSNSAQNYFVVNGSTGGVGIGTATPGLSNGYAKLDLIGSASNANGPHIKLTTNTDAYPVLQGLGWTHDNVALSFDSYYDGSWRSADVGSNFQIYKINDAFRFRYDSGIAAGSAVTWEEGIALTSTGNVGIGTGTPSRTLDVRGMGNFSGTIWLNNNTDVISNLTVLNNFWNSNATIWAAINAGAGTYNSSYQTITNTSSTYVPYVGALTNVNLGVYNLTTTGMLNVGSSSTNVPLTVSGNLTWLDTALYVKNANYDNLLSNGNFEYLNGANSAPGWSFTTNMSINTTTVHNGLYSVTGIADGNVRDSTSNARIPITKGSGEKIIVEYWYNTSAGYSGTAGIWLLSYNKTGLSNADWSGCYVTFASTSWTKRVCTFNFDSSTKDIQYIQPAMSIRNDVAIGSIFYFDDIKIYKTYGNGTPMYAGTYFDADNPLYYLNLSSTGISLVTGGKIGIGTTTPQATLDVRGEGNFSGDVYIRNSTSLISNLTVLNNFWNSNSTIWSAINAKAVASSINTQIAQNFTNATAYTNNANNTLWTFISNNLSASYVPYVGATRNTVLGNYNLSIGLGRTTPAATLDINGSIALINYPGTGPTRSYFVGANSFALASLGSGGNITSSSDGSFVQGYIASGILSSTSSGSFVQGYGISGNLTSSGSGSFAQGYVNSGNYIFSSGQGSFAQGASQSGTAKIISSNTGSFAQGNAAGGTINASEVAAFAQGGSNTQGNIISSGTASFAQGYAVFANLISSGTASFAQGYAFSGNITASGIGAFAGGASSGANILSSGRGSFVWGNNSNSSGNYGIVFGQGIANTISNSFSVGFGNTGTIPSLFVNGSAVGIGTTTPQATLDVRGAGNFSGDVIIRNSTSLISNLTVLNNFWNSNATIWSAINAGAGTYNSSYQTITNTTATYVPYTGALNNVVLGNNNLSIGLGRTTPAATLDINGSLAAVNYFGSSGGYYNIGKNSFIIGTIGANGNITSTGSGSIALGYASNGNITALLGAGALAGGTTSLEGRILSSNSGSLAYGQASFGNLTSSGSGSIALGSAAFGQLFATSSGSIALGYASNGAGILSTNLGSFAGGYVNGGNITSSGTGSIALGASVNSVGGIISSGAGSFAGGYAFRGFVLSSGDGSFVWGNNSNSSGNYGIVFGQGIANTISNSFSVGFGNTGTIPSLFVNGTAVGIGTTTPTQKLDVNGIVNASGFLVNGTPLTSGGAGGTPIFYNISGLIMNNYSYGQAVNISNNLYVNASNVGIGTTTPLKPLVIQGANTVTLLVNTTSGTNYAEVALASGTKLWTLSHKNNDNYVGFFEDGSTPRFVIQNATGRVGLNTTNPKTTLDVQGDVILNASAVGGNVVIQL